MYIPVIYIYNIYYCYIYIYCNGKGVVCEGIWRMFSFGGKNKHIFCVDMARLEVFLNSESFWLQQ